MTSSLFSKFSLLVCSLAVCSMVHVVAQGTMNDGSLWLSFSAGPPPESRALKSSFAAGVLSGLRAAPTLTIFLWANAESNTAEYTERALSLKPYVERYLQKSDVPQLVAGLDAFYADYANRRIKIGDAVAIVLRRATGDNESDVADWLNTLRKQANK